MAYPAAAQRLVRCALLSVLLFATSCIGSCIMASGGNCTAAAARAGLLVRECISNDRTGTGTGCITDACSLFATGTSCIDSGSGCSVVPISGVICMNSQLLCWSLNETQCGERKICKWVQGLTFATSYCNYTVPDISPAAARAQELADNCPAIHPVVLAILVIMFVTLVIAVVIVLVVVCLNKKKQEDIDKEEEEAEAEAAIGGL